MRTSGPVPQPDPEVPEAGALRNARPRPAHKGDGSKDVPRRQAGYGAGRPRWGRSPTGAAGVVSGEKRASFQARGRGRGGGLPSPSAPPVPAPGTSRAQGDPCPPHLSTLRGLGWPLGFPACFLPSPPHFPTQGQPGAGWHAGSHPGLADLHIKARGSPPPRPPAFWKPSAGQNNTVGGASLAVTAFS